MQRGGKWALAIALVITVAAVGQGAVLSGTGAAEIQQSGPTLTISDATVDEGEQTELTVVLSEVPDGLSGFLMTLETSDSSVATIEGASVSSAADGLTTVTPANDGSSIFVKGADLDDNTVAGDQDVELFTVTVQGQSAGTADIEVVSKNIDNDDGFDIEPVVQSGAVTVESTATPTPDPATPTPDPATPTPDPATPTPDPATPTPDPEPAFFEVSGLNAPQSATQGDLIDVSATVTNTGDESDTQTVGFRVDLDGDGALSDETFIISKEITLSSGESTSVEFTDLDTSVLPTGDLRHGIISDDGSAVTTITINEPEEPEPEPADYQVSELRAPDTVTQGETISPNAKVTNEGGDGNKTVEFRLDLNRDGELTDDEVVASKYVELDSGSSQTVSFGLTVPSDLAPDRYDHGIFTEDDSETDSILVNEKPPEGPDEPEEPEEPKEPEQPEEPEEPEQPEEPEEPDQPDQPDEGDGDDGSDGDAVPTHYQVDFVEGEPIEQFDLSEGRTYHGEGRFISNNVVSDDNEPADSEPVGTYESVGCEVSYSDISYNASTGEAVITVSVADDGSCAGITLSLAGYELPEGENTWTLDNAEDQELTDFETVTLEAGEDATLTIDVDG
jgi:hypothetical protein